MSKKFTNLRAAPLLEVQKSRGAGQSSGLSIAGIRSCTSATSEFGFVVSLVHVSIALLS